MTTTIKRDALCIAVHNNGEYGTFFVRQGVITMDNPRDERYWCQLTVQSSFGSVGYHWGNMGCPAHRFFDKDNTSYFGDKLWGTNAKVFDVDTAMASVKVLIQKAVDNDEFTADEMAEMLEDIDVGAATEWEWCAAVHRNDAVLNLIHENAGIDDRVPNPQMVGFFTDLWPEFVEALKAEAEKPEKQPRCYGIGKVGNSNDFLYIRYSMEGAQLASCHAFPGQDAIVPLFTKD